jgi:hypothetical protein
MIPTLLWQCPLCHADDALRHKIHYFRPDELWCTQCRTVWEVQRVIADDFRLKVIRGDSSTAGQEKPLAEWYDLMKAGLNLVVRESAFLHLEPGEELHVEGKQADLLAEEDSPLLTRWDQHEAPWQKEGDLGLSFMKKWDVGRLFLTSERMIWAGERGMLSFWLTKVNSVHTEVTWYLGMLYGLRLYKFRFREESILKWLTYIALEAKRIERIHQHQISLSNY